MNAVFAVIFIVSSVYLTVTAPETLLSGLTGGAERALRLCFTLTVIYAVWLGVFNVLEESKVTEKLARILKKPVRLLFGGVSDKAAEYLSLNVTANMLGLGSVATPMGIKAAECLDESGEKYAQYMLFAVAATSIQLIPTTAMTLRAQAGSISPTDIFLPTLLSTTVSTVCAILLTMVFVKR